MGLENIHKSVKSGEEKILAVLPSDGSLVQLYFNQLGYFRSKQETGDRSRNYEIANRHNEPLGITPDDAKQMLDSAIFGWGVIFGDQTLKQASGYDQKQFEVFISRPGRSGFASGTVLELPATAAQIADALDRARITTGRDIYSVGVHSSKLEYLTERIPENVNLHELNLLAQRLASLDTWEHDCFEGLVKIDAAKPDCETISLERLINMTYSTDACQIAFNVRSDKELGAFYLENGFYDERLASMSEEMIGMLDHEKLGKQSRLAENGIYTKAGYVVSSGEDISTEYSSDRLPPFQKPDYVFLLEIASMPEGDEPNDKNCVTVKLPISEQDLTAALSQIGMESLDGCCFYYYESTIPALSEMFMFMDDFNDLNTIAHTYADFTPSDKVKYKALLEATVCDDLIPAIRIADSIAEFTLHGDVTEPEDYARKHLESLNEIDGGSAIDRHLNLTGYGMELMKRDNALQTAYGAIRRLDGGQVALPEPQGNSMQMQ